MLFGGENCGFIFNRVRYLTGITEGITSVFSHKLAGIKIDSYDCLVLEKKLIFQNAIRHI